LGAGIFGLVKYLTGYVIMFAPTIPDTVARTLMWMGAAWLLIFVYKLFRAPGIVSRRDKPLLITLGSEEPFHRVTENENIVDQTVSIKLKNISDVRVRHCKLQITYIKPAIARAVPIFIGACASMDPCEVEHIPISCFKKTKKAPLTRWFGICVPLAPVYGGNMLLIQEGSSYDITLEASCDEAEESHIINCCLWVDETDILRLAAR
jgi:hypothetical protein